MKVIVLLFAMCIGSGLALKDALSGLTYAQETINLNQDTQQRPSLAQDSVTFLAKTRV